MGKYEKNMSDDDMLYSAEELSFFEEEDTEIYEDNNCTKVYEFDEHNSQIDFDQLQFDENIVTNVLVISGSL